jgi:hypothetical protein
MDTSTCELEFGGAQLVSADDTSGVARLERLNSDRSQAWIFLSITIYATMSVVLDTLFEGKGNAI